MSSEPLKRLKLAWRVLRGRPLTYRLRLQQWPKFRHDTRDLLMAETFIMSEEVRPTVLWTTGDETVTEAQQRVERDYRDQPPSRSVGLRVDSAGCSVRNNRIQS